MKAFHYAHLNFPLPERHRYPLPRYQQLYTAVLRANLLPPTHVCPGPRASDNDLLLAHTADYLRKLTTGQLSNAEQRQLGLPFSELVVERARHIVGATISAARCALRDGVSFVLGGGTHHAFAAYGSGFCVLNDVVVATRVLQQEGAVRHTAVFDCDVHQGDGTAAMAANDPTLFTLSIHGAHNFPFAKQKSNLDIPLPDGTTDRAYLAAVRRSLRYVVRQVQPDLLFYIAGADPYQGDALGRLAVTAVGLRQRDRHVLVTCRRYGLPVVVLMGGGYARPISRTVELNVRTISEAVRLFRQPLFLAQGDREK